MKKIKYFIDKLKKEKSVVGILLFKGKMPIVKKNYCDQIIEIFIDHTHHKNWINHNFVSCIFSIDNRFKDVIRVFDFEGEKEEIWESDKLWRRINGHVVYQKDVNLKKLIEEKQKKFEKKLSGILIRTFYDIEWYVSLSRIWIERGDLHSAYHMTNIAVDNLIKGLFLLNKKLYPPREYWIPFIKELDWVPINFMDKLNQKLYTQDMNREIIFSKGKIIYELYKQYLKKIQQNLHKYARPLRFFNLFWLYLLLFIYFNKEIKIIQIKKIGMIHYLTAIPLLLLINTKKKHEDIYISIDNNKMENIAMMGDPRLPRSVEQELSHLWKKLKYKEVKTELELYFQNISVLKLPLI
ncbi:hypothetical protein CVT91_01590 [Candidatus Atribacteria bacterium HGW-Atribacteria-1]|nr:MAG: hypothetical protein CVT91_01590 [Candidatus Atribacteria bacterium HGW-Atribacteria-1]